MCVWCMTDSRALIRRSISSGRLRHQAPIRSQCKQLLQSTEGHLTSSQLLIGQPLPQCSFQCCHDPTSLQLTYNTPPLLLLHDAAFILYRVIPMFRFYRVGPLLLILGSLHRLSRWLMKGRKLRPRPLTRACGKARRPYFQTFTVPKLCIWNINFDKVILTELAMLVKCAQTPIRWPTTPCPRVDVRFLCVPPVNFGWLLFLSAALASVLGWKAEGLQTRWPASALINKNYPRLPVGFCSVMILGSLVQAARVIWSLAALLFSIPSTELQESHCVYSARDHIICGVVQWLIFQLVKVLSKAMIWLWG